MEEQRICIGNQTSCHVPGEVPYHFALRHGFDAFEWFSDKRRTGWCEDDVGAGARARLRQEAWEKRIRFSVHAPVAADPVLPAGADAIRRSIQFAADVNASLVNVHLFPEHGAKPFAEALRPLLKIARTAGIRLSLENTPETSPDHFNAVFGVLSAMPEAAGHVGMCLDTGHANLFSGTRNDYLRFAELLGDHVPIVHWHAHENWGDRDSHLTLFTGPAGKDDRGLRKLVRWLGRRGFHGSIVLEQWPHPPEQLVDARQRLQRLIETEKAPCPTSSA